MTTAGNIFALDLGTNTQFQSVWLGPSLGWQFLPVVPELLVETAGALNAPTLHLASAVDGLGALLPSPCLA